MQQTPESNHHISHDSNKFDGIKSLSIGLVLFGVLVRLSQYFDNRSLWFDEASLALNIVNRSYLELLGVLDHDQAAPPIFLWIERLFVQVFGNSEYSLRLFPLISGMVALFLFYRMATLLTSGITTVVAIALFASLRYIVYYAAEVKQYATDLMLALLIFLVLFSLRDQILKPRQILFLSLLGSVCIWTSHPAIFVLVGIEMANLLGISTQKLKAILLNRIPIYGTWLSSFILLYLFTIKRTEANESLLSYWDGSYPDSLFDLPWLIDSLGRFFYRPLGFLGITDGIAIAAFICGCIFVYQQNKFNFLLLNAPLLITLLASFLHKYPFRERLVLFLAPFAILIIATGISTLLTEPKGRYRSFKLVGISMAVALVGFPLFQASQSMISPHRFDEIRPVIEYVKSHQQAGDTLYIFPETRRQFLYYAPKHGYSQKDYIFGNYDVPSGRAVSNENRQNYKQEIEQLRGRKRVWFLLARSASESEKTLLNDLNQVGKKLDVFKQPDAIACLYDLSL
ncbi:MAG: glycosyltransferase family 39 protein [Leptolyngbyaceae cyanobacterium RU_5_1]|nr:glycosyltransferase family 39 protein [Leptolyngbyaceae cyanobacterium RU_5_1]